MRLKSFTSPSIFSPTSAVPAFPGRIYILLQFLLIEIERAIECSLPPPPIINIFISLF